MKEYDVAIIGAGFVGSSIAKHLSKSLSVVTFDVNPSPPFLRGVTKVEHRVCDVRRLGELKDSLGQPKVVVHTAIIQIPAIDQMKEQAYGVNIIGTQNICEVVKESPEILGLILCGSWHVFGERDYGGTVDSAFGYRPDKVEERARLYVISKMMQEGIVRFFGDMVGKKTFGIVRLGTVLGENMPKKTAANIFIENGLQGRSITPYKHTMHRPMLYVSIRDVCKVFESYIERILRGRSSGEESKSGIFNLFYPEPITILELAEVVSSAIVECTKGEVIPKVEIIDTGAPPMFRPDEKNTLNVDIEKTLRFFELETLTSPKEAVFEIVRGRVQVLAGHKA